MIFFDSYAIIEIINGNPNYLKYNEEDFLTNTLNLSEVVYALLKQFDEQEVDEIINQFNFIFIEITDEIAIESSKFRYKNRSKSLSYADCISYIMSVKMGIKFLTGDKEFENLKDVEFVK